MLTTPILTWYLFTGSTSANDTNAPCKTVKGDGWTTPLEDFEDSLNYKLVMLGILRREAGRHHPLEIGRAHV